MAMRRLVGEDFRIDVVDVDDDPALVEQYDELVPVLMGCLPGLPPAQLCNYYLNDNAVRNFLAGHEGNSGISPPESGKMRD